ncbi:hypothetical protein G6F18_002358 [Rhizopus arrhizus]|nr:hypothetical protein G6F20_002497 [Rhizopus arrhizus]KAG0843430.1 hypothetical protein G6F18_002358 [Rhizopus arrhizus]
MLIQSSNHQSIHLEEASNNETTPLLSTQKDKCKQLKENQLLKLLPSVVLGALIWFGMTPNEELTLTAIHLLAVFISCIFALITTSIDISMLVLTGLTILATTHSFECLDHATGQSTECRLCGDVNPLTGGTFQCNAGKDSFEQSLEGFSSSVVWLIFAAFHLGKAVEMTQLGRRISLLMIKSFGKHVLGLGYAIVLSELLLAPFVPSNTARGGGIVLPIVRSIATTLDSTPELNPELGQYFILIGNHANLLSASMYLTAKANILLPHLNFDFMTWLQGSVVPCMVCAISLPLLLRWTLSIDKIDNGKRTGSNAVKHAQIELDKMGPVSKKEWQLCLVLLSCLIMWITASITHLDATLVALIGIVSLLYMGTITWRDVSTNTNAWDTLFWLGGFITIAQQLSEAGASKFLGVQISHATKHFNLPVLPSLAIAYFLTTFLFSSLSAHIVAFASTFLDAGHMLGANPMVLTALIAYFGVLAGCMTNFSTGMAAMYYTTGYVPRSKWFLIGFQMAIFYLFVYFTIGMSWWKLLGWL